MTNIRKKFRFRSSWLGLKCKTAKGPFTLDDNDVILLSSCVNSFIGDNANHLWQHADNVKNMCRCRQVRTGPKGYYIIVVWFNWTLEALF